jgi:radical SAM-linked protein
MAAGWASVKLYFMIGHPTEGEQDFEEMAQLVDKIKAILRKYPGRRHITLGFSPFVPKAHTPFQWERQDDFETTRTKLAWIKNRLRGQGVEIRHHDTADTAIEGIISRSGREIANVIEGAWRRGARFDGWSEHCRFEHWLAAMAEAGLTLTDVFREIGEGEDLPWEIVSYKIDRPYFLKERHRAYRDAETDECKHERCTACGVCDFDSMRNILAAPPAQPAPEPAAGLLQGVPSTTVRLGYRKRQSLRFISHLDVLRELERTLRRADVPVLYSEGFSPRPRISAGQPLPLGWTSDSEWIDVELEGTWNETRLEQLLAGLNQHVAGGIEFFVGAAMPERTPSLSASQGRARFLARLPNPPFASTLGDLQQAVDAFLARDRVVVRRERRGAAQRRTGEKVFREVDIRPLVYELAVLSADTVSLTVAAGSEGSVKPTDVLGAVLGMEDSRQPLIQIHKLETTLTDGTDPAAQGLARAEGHTLETGDSHSWIPARDAGSDSGG